VLCHELSLASAYRRLSVSLCLCVSIIFVGVHGLGILEVQKEMIETQRHKDTKVINSLFNIEIIKSYTAPCSLFVNSELKVYVRVLLVISLKLKNLF
jgi:hypothetical protein